ncbi:hypothetical protein PENSPDRAFT_748606 [Peniophora sp. CONT]|nr:hypothetical protein PENSPDRAFT_748606 [Peniophora sp. CONT]
MPPNGAVPDSESPTPTSNAPQYHTCIASIDAYVNILDLTLNKDSSQKGLVAREYDFTERLLQQLLNKLRVHRNASLAPISRLPPEVLNMIFAELVYSDSEIPHTTISASASNLYHLAERFVFADVCAGDYGFYPDPQGHHRCSLGWVRLTHVCARWRYILLDTPRYWADFVGTLPLPAAVKEFLRRSGNVLPVTARIVCMPDGNVTDWSSIAGPMIIAPWERATFESRIHRLSLLDLREPGFYPIDESFANLYFPNLEVLDIARALCGRELYPQRGAGIWNALRNLCVPKLHTIRLRNVAIPWFSNSLVCLSLQLCYNEQVSPLRLLELLAFSHTTLEFLELVYAIDGSSPGFDHADILELFLLRLKYLHIQDRDDQMASFLRLLRLPPTVKLRLGILISLALERAHCGPQLDGIFIASHTDSYGDIRIDMRMHDWILNSEDLWCKRLRMVEEEPKLHFVLDVFGTRPLKPENSLLSLCSFIDPSRFLFVSFDLPSWSAVGIMAATEQFPNTISMRIFNPLNVTYDDLGQHRVEENTRSNDGSKHGDHSEGEEETEIPFPYLPHGAHKDQTHPSCCLELLWIVQTEALAPLPFSVWCEDIADQLRTSSLLRSTGQCTPVKPLKALHIEVLGRLGDQPEYAEDVLRTQFEDLAYNIGWKLA